MRRLSGTTDWFAVATLSGSPSSVVPHTLFTVIATPTLPLGTYRAVSVSTAAQVNAAAILISSTGGVTFQQRNAASGTAYTHTQSSVFTAGSAPVALALVFDGTNCIAYVDGTQVNSAATSLGARGAFTSCGTQTDSDATTSMDVGSCLVIHGALSAAQIRTIGNARAPLGIASANVRAWWPFRTGRPAVDLSPYLQNLTGTTTAGAPDERRTADMRRAKVFLPQYLAQPPLVSGNATTTGAPSFSVARAAAVASTAAATSNIPSAALTVARLAASTAPAATDIPAATLARAGTVASTSQTVTDVPSATLGKAATTASSAPAVTDIPSATLARAQPIAATAAAATDIPAVVLAKTATFVSSSPTVTDMPSAAVSAGLGALAENVSDIPSTTVTQSRAASSTASANTDIPVTALSKTVPLASSSASVADCPAVTLTAAKTFTGTCAATTNCPAITLSVAKQIGGTSSTVTNCPPATAVYNLPISSTCSTVTNCPPVTAVPLVFLAISCTARTVTDAPSLGRYQLFTSVAIAQPKRPRIWPTRY